MTVRYVTSALVLTFALAVAAPASAIQILGFGQVGTDPTFVGTENGSGGTDLSATNVEVQITNINSADVTPIDAYFNLTASSTGNVVYVTSTDTLAQAYSGTFTLTSGMGGTGTNYLSGDFSDIFSGTAFGQGATLSASEFGDVVNFTSDVLSPLNSPLAIALSLTALDPGLFSTLDPTTECTDISSGSGQVYDCGTIAAFTASFTGTFSADDPPYDTPVPEPGSMILLGTGLMGLAASARRRMSRKNR